jgi:anti-sigma regulatory factor (Ser/Thr protein kinase)
MIQQAAIESRSTRFAPGPDAPRLARRWISWLARYLHASTAEDLKLVVSELVTNCVQHAGCLSREPIHVFADVRPKAVRVMVRDGGRGFQLDSLQALPDAEHPRGWGLVIVRQLSHRLLIDTVQGTVMFEMQRASIR